MWKNCPLRRRLVSAVRGEVLTHEGVGAGSAANGHACGATALGYNEPWFAACVAHLRVVQLVFLDDALKRQEAANRVLEGGGHRAGPHLQRHLYMAVRDGLSEISKLT